MGINMLKPFLGALIVSLTLSACGGDGSGHSVDDALVGQVSAPTTAPAPVAGSPVKPKWVEGKDFFRIEPAQQPRFPDKIEVVEFFSYGCIACNEFHEVADRIAKALPANARMRYIPASAIKQENWPMLQRAFYTAQVLGVADQANDAMYDAVWKTGSLSSYGADGSSLKPLSALPTIGEAARVYAGFHVDPAKFVATAQSPEVERRMKVADAAVRAYGIEGTPTITVNGKYRFDVSSAGGYEQMQELTKWLVERERIEGTAAE